MNNKPTKFGLIGCIVSSIVGSLFVVWFALEFLPVPTPIDPSSDTNQSAQVQPTPYLPAPEKEEAPVSRKPYSGREVYDDKDTKQVLSYTRGYMTIKEFTPKGNPDYVCILAGNNGISCIPKGNAETSLPQ